jgi:hypothetical protein
VHRKIKPCLSHDESHSHMGYVPLLWAEATVSGFEIKIPGSTGINTMFL